MAQCAVHALKRLARVERRRRERFALRQFLSRTLRSQKTQCIFQWVQNLGTPRLLHDENATAVLNISFCDRLLQAVLYAGAFGVVFLVAMLNPSGFLVILEVFTSLGVNAGTVQHFHVV